MKIFDLVLSNPPFGKNKSGERAARDNLNFPTNNKHLNFLQNFYRSLKTKGRATVILPDKVLLADGEGERIRVDLMDKCNQPPCRPALANQIFYAQGQYPQSPVLRLAVEYAFDTPAPP